MSTTAGKLRRDCRACRGPCTTASSTSSKRFPLRLSSLAESALPRRRAFISTPLMYCGAWNTAGFLRFVRIYACVCLMLCFYAPKPERKVVAFGPRLYPFFPVKLRTHALHQSRRNAMYIPLNVFFLFVFFAQVVWAFSRTDTLPRIYWRLLTLFFLFWVSILSRRAPSRKRQRADADKEVRTDAVSPPCFHWMCGPAPQCRCVAGATAPSFLYTLASLSLSPFM